MRGLPHVTLAIDAGDLDADEAVERLGALVEGAGAADVDEVDLLAVMGPLDEVGRARLDTGVHAVYSERPADAGPAPCFGAASLAELRALAAADVERAPCGARSLAGR